MYIFIWAEPVEDACDKIWDAGLNWEGALTIFDGRLVLDTIILHADL